MALDISKAFGRAWHSDLLHKLTSFGVSGQIFGLTFSFLNNRRLQVVLDGKSSQENIVNAGVSKGPFLVLHFSSSWFHFLFLEVGLLVILIDCMIFLSPFLDVTRMSMSTASFLAQLGSRILCL